MLWQRLCFILLENAFSMSTNLVKWASIQAPIKVLRHGSLFCWYGFLHQCYDMFIETGSENTPVTAAALWDNMWKSLQQTVMELWHIDYKINHSLNRELKLGIVLQCLFSLRYDDQLNWPINTYGLDVLINDCQWLKAASPNSLQMFWSLYKNPHKISCLSSRNISVFWLTQFVLQLLINPCALTYFLQPFLLCLNV